MLHILWVILKFILIALGVILGIVFGLLLLAVLLLLFCPVEYQASAEKAGKAIRAKGRVSWLFRGISLYGEYREGKPLLSIRIFGIPLDNLKRWLSGGRKKKGSSSQAKRRKTASHPQQAPQKRLEEESSQEQTALPGPERETEIKAEKAPEEERNPKEETKPKEEIRPEEQTAEETSSESREPSLSEEKKLSFFKNICEKIRGIPGKIKAIIDKIKVILKNMQESLLKIPRVIQRTLDKFRKWRDFFQEEQVKEAVSLVKTEGIRLIRHIFPRKISGRVVFGMEDPSKTGMILAILGMTMPIHKNRVAVVPVYDQVMLDGDVSLKGRIYGFAFVRAAVRLWFDKNIKYLRKRWKQKEEM